MNPADEFAERLDAHAGLVGKIARAYTRTPDDRRDLAQEIAAQLWAAYPRFDPTRAKFSTWLYRVALNVAISHLRRAALRTFEPLADPPALDPDPRAAALYAAIHALAPLDRALVLLYLEDRSHAEIADVLGIGEANVAVKLHRIKHALRARLGA